MPATPTPLPTRPQRRRGNTRFRKTRLLANRPPRQRRSRLAAKRRVVLLGPFGERLIPPTGVGLELPFRFSTKYQDAETGLYSYIFRPYDPLTGRWLSRDPIEEEGGTNLYGFISNASISTVDILGLVEWVVGKDWIAAAEGEKDNATATEAAGVTFRNVFLTQNAEVSVTKHPSCECYIASLSKPFKAKAVVATTTPNVGIWRNGLLDAASVKAVQLHEAWHVGIFVTYVKTVWEPLEQWSQNYRKYFKTESEAREAIQWDMRYALAELNRWQGRWKDGQDRAFGHVNLYRTPLRPQETFDHGKQRIISRWSAPDNGNWGAKANALVQNWDVNYTRSERKGNCP